MVTKASGIIHPHLLSEACFMGPYIGYCLNCLWKLEPDSP